MAYYNVAVADPSFHGEELLTYEYPDHLDLGTIVHVPVGRKSAFGLVVSVSKKPAFKTRAMLETYQNLRLPKELVDLLSWLKDYYPPQSSNAELIRLCVPPNIAPIKDLHPAVTKKSSVKLPVLTKEQSRAIEAINQKRVGTSLIHGVTGSGKTRIYLELAKQTIAKGLSVIVLTPEIGLTAPVNDYFSRHLSVDVITLHSGLTITQKRDTWQKIMLTEKPVVVIGPRSALFSPLSSIGLIVIDEAHEQAYKQDNSPRYQATRVAAKLAHLHQAKLVLGTATPLVGDYFTLQSKGSVITRLQEAALTAAKLPTIELVTTTDRQKFTKSAYLSDPLLDMINASLSRKEQSLIYLNRRGSAQTTLCQNCGWRALCSNCDLPMTYHADTYHLRCHTCGRKEAATTACPTCGGADIVFRGIGTKALVEELVRLYPHSKIQRFDSDVSKQDKLENQYQQIVDGSIDIIVGTQVLGKGFDLPKLSTVGVVQADTALAFPDYLSNELTFQQLTQIIGRVGRGHRPGGVVVQTYSPNNYAIQAALSRDYTNFYKSELVERKAYLFPPYVFMLRLYCSRSTSSGAEKACKKLMEFIEQLRLPVQVLGPGPTLHERHGNLFRWQIVVKARQRSLLVSIVKNLPANWIHDLDPATTL